MVKALKRKVKIQKIRTLPPAISASLEAVYMLVGQGKLFVRYETGFHVRGKKELIIVLSTLHRPLRLVAHTNLKL